MSRPPIIGITAGSHAGAKPYIEAVRRNDGESRLIIPGRFAGVDKTLSQIGALLFTGGIDLGSTWYPADRDGVPPSQPASRRDAMEKALLLAGLDRDTPMLCIGRGMQALNIVLGGSLIGGFDSHASQRKGREDASSHHRIFIAPGSKLASIIGSGGFVRVNSRHHLSLREPQKSPLLIASAYSLEDGVIEALESPEHNWVVAVQFHPERSGEIPPNFERLFQALSDRAQQ